VVKGLDDFPRPDQPPVPVVHVAFQLMVGAGGLLALLSIYALAIGLLRGRFPEGRGFLRLLMLAGPLALLGLEAGWVVTEVGRQPWIVHQVARTADMVTRAPYVGWMLLATVGVYGVIGIGTIGVLRRLALVPLEDESRGA